MTGGSQGVPTETHNRMNLPSLNIKRHAKIIRRHSVLLAPLTLLATMFFGSPISAHVDSTSRNSCRVFVRFKVDSWLTIFGQDMYWHKDKGCGYATAESLFYKPNGQVGARAYVYVSASGVKADVWSLSPQITAGGGYPVVTNDINGLSLSSISYSVDISTNNIVTLTNFSGALMALTNSLFSGDMTIVVYNSAPNAPDPEPVTPENTIWQGSVWIENGQLTTSGGFANSDFELSTGIYTNAESTIPVVQITPVAGLMKMIPVSDTISNDNIAVTGIGDIGYGSFNEAQLIASLTNTLPGGGVEPLNFTCTNGVLGLSWLGNASLVSSPTLTPPVFWTLTTNQSNTQFIVPAGTQSYYRLLGP